MLPLAAAALAALGAVEAPVTDVTVFSDRARVTRTARVAVSGTTEVDLGLLLSTIDAQSIRVEAAGAQVERVDLRAVDPSRIPEGEARALLEKLERLGDEIESTRRQVEAYRQHAEALLRIAPQPPPADALRPPPKLDGSGWGAAAAFITDAAASAQARARALEQRLETLRRERQLLQEQARILGGAQRLGGHHVFATLQGSGTATVRMTYFASPARWLPTYDLQLSPETQKVQLAFAGLVSQETGESWTDAALTLSTAVPSSTLRMPELARWTIGERDRFIPRPAPKPIVVAPAPAAPELPRAQEEDVLRQRLLQAAARGEDAQAGAVPVQDLAYDVAPPAMPSPPRTRERQTAKRPSSAPPPSAPSMAAEPEGMAYEDRATEVEAVTASAERRQRAATSAMNLAPPGAYRAPTYSPELPAAAAGGYDLSWPSLQRETVDSGGGTRRVALLAQSWPVSVERRIYPALAQDAYLVAQLESPSKTPLPAGEAQLFVGADPSGTARLELIAPGQTITLPLGLDRALKPVRNVELVTAEEGFIVGKDDLSRYVVRIELANPYPFPIFVKVFDQWPVTDDQNVEVKLLETKPWAIQDPVRGSLQWDLTVPASGRTDLSFTFSIRRPKNWRLHQRQER